MSKTSEEIEFTRASSKGQVVIPTKIRKKLDIRKGSVFAVASDKNLIVLKKIETGISEADLKTLRLVEEAWKDIEKGKYKSSSKEAFFKELREW